MILVSMILSIAQFTCDEPRFLVLGKTQSTVSVLVDLLLQ